MIDLFIYSLIGEIAFFIGIPLWLSVYTAFKFVLLLIFLNRYTKKDCEEVKNKMTKEKYVEVVRFKDLSGFLKYAVLGGILYLTILVIAILLGALSFFLITA